MKGVMIKVSGSLLSDDKNNVNANFLKEFSQCISMLRKDYDIGIVPGGGPAARRYIEISRGIGCNEAQADMVADKIQRLHAALIIASSKEVCYPSPIDDPDLAYQVINSQHKIGVISGKFPGQTTDNIATQFAAYLNIDKVVKVSKLGSIYDKDPNIYPDAIRLEAVSYDKLIGLASEDKRIAGSSCIMDQISAKCVKNNGIDLFFISGADISKIREVIEYTATNGSLVNSNGTRDKSKGG